MIDVSGMTDFRNDYHPSICRKQNLTEEEWNKAIFDAASAGKGLLKVSSGVKSRIGKDLVIYVARIGKVNFNT